MFQIASDGKHFVVFFYIIAATFDNEAIISASLCLIYFISDHDAAINRYSRLSKRKENEKVLHFEIL